MATTTAILYSPDDQAPPDAVQRWVTALAVPVLRVQDDETLMGSALRSRPRVVIFDSRSRGDDVRAALKRLKSDSYTGVVPAVVISSDDPTSFDAGFRAGADEVIRDRLEESEVTIRLDDAAALGPRFVRASVDPAPGRSRSRRRSAPMVLDVSSGRAKRISITSRNSTIAIRTTRAIASSAFWHRFSTMWSKDSAMRAGLSGTSAAMTSSSSSRLIA